MEKTKIRVGVSIIKQLSETFYPSVNAVFGELVSNASDAFAKTVRITLSNEDIVIEDDGIGMSPEELTKFFYISASRKDSGTIKQFKEIKRSIIGRFGIGKLSMYRICKKFEITTWKDGIESNATLDFNEFEKKEFIDDFGLDVAQYKTKTHKTGTIIVMSKLKQDIDEIFIKLIRRSLSRSMPLKPDFKLIVNEMELEPIKKNGNLINVNEDVEGVGYVRGQIVISDSNIGNEAGIYFRVFGRVVNESNPGPINVAILSHGMSYVNKLYADLNIDSLNEAIMANRSGFIEDNKKYVLFITWLKKKLNSIFSELYTAQKNILTDTEKELPEQIAEETRKLFEKEDSKEKWEKIEKETGKFENKLKKRVERKINVAPLYKQKEKPKYTNLMGKRLDELEEELKEIKIGNNKLKIKIQRGRRLDPECSISKDGTTLIINKDHPQYKRAEEISPETILYHCIKVIIVDLALTMAGKDINIFKKTYDLLSRQSVEIK